MFNLADLDLPIGRVIISGPGVDRLASRKEDNNNARVDIEQLKQRYQSKRNSIIGGLKRLAEAN